MSAFAIPLAATVVRAGLAAKLGSKAIDKAKNTSVELYGYDFVGLMIKLVVYFVVAYFVEKYIWWASQKPVNQVLAGIFGAIGGLPLFAASPAIIKYFDSSEVNRGIKFWDIVKVGAVGLVLWEAMNYHSAQEKLGGKVSPMTIGVFGLILSLLGFMAIPDVLKKLQEHNIINSGV